MSMKKFSTRALSTLSLSITLAMSAVMPLQGVAQTRQDEIQLANDAPDRHVVVKGDTLWGIAGLFLKEPWRWPEIWQLNKAEIKNPHLIYPGDIVYLDRSGATPRLRLGRNVYSKSDSASHGDARHGVGINHLEPTVRVSNLDKAAIPSISLSSIQAFINRPLVVDEQGLQSAPYVVAPEQEGRVNVGNADRVYVRGIKADSTARTWHIYRPAKPLIDPVTRKTLAYEATYLGTAELVRHGDPATLSITKVVEEITDGDRLVPADVDQDINFVPRAPETANLAGRIISIYRGVSMVGRNSIVAINLGSQSGLANGHVLKIEHAGRTVKDRVTKEMVRLPNEDVGQLLVFRTFHNIAYGLVVNASAPISVNDIVTNP
ncbi:MAG: LysM peptidoglycan-binding domain-containing protein [Lautropia sp.]|nr:LysM peptidoglycan-binding domain-containing protein [Lautropia sp.]